MRGHRLACDATHMLVLERPCPQLIYSLACEMLRSSGLLETREGVGSSAPRNKKTALHNAAQSAHLSILPNRSARCRFVARLTAFWPSRSAMKASAPLCSEMETGREWSEGGSDITQQLLGHKEGVPCA